jgi:RNA polymerase sigma-70 factor (ECF subfamily)
MPGEARPKLLTMNRWCETSTGQDDDALIAAAREDPAAFAVLYRRYVDAVYRYCYRRLGNREAAEDATSLVFTRAMDALPRYREGGFRAWVFAIAHNTISNELRERGRRAGQPIETAHDLADPSLGPEEIAIGREGGANIRALLARLPDGERHLLELRLAGLSGPEIARVLGRSHGAVKIAQFRAIARLRALVAETAEPGEQRNGS